MELNRLTAISPIDGRYRDKTEPLCNYFSEASLIKYRVKIEVEYFVALCELPLPQLKGIKKNTFTELRNIYKEFTIEDARKVKETEKITNHDVKAVEYLVKEKFTELGLTREKEMVHFGLTSQDINNTATPLLIKDAVEKIYLPALNNIITSLEKLQKKWQNITVLARTHGQPATPTNLGKEIQVFSQRLKVQRAQLMTIPFSAKFGGATGNFNAHHVAFPKIDWISFSNKFVKNLGITRSHPTTQIEHYDNLAALFDGMKRINTILLDLNRDMWLYISMDYFQQVIKKGEIGSSAMPHKVNPIDFENSEGNIGLANAIFEHLSAKLPVSRLQRDLTDSTVLRNIGVPMGHTLIALISLQKGLDKLILNKKKIAEDLDNNWVVVAEAIQTILRREGYPNPYEALKKLTRTNNKMDKSSIHEFIKSLKINNKVKEELLAISPSNYIGIF